MLDFYPKRHQLQILANNINKGGHTLVSGAMREGGGQPFFKVFLCVGSAGIVCLLGYRKLKVGTHSSYICNWKLRKTGVNKLCMWMKGAPLDAAITKRILEVMVPAQLEIAQEAWKELERREMDMNQQWLLKEGRV